MKHICVSKLRIIGSDNGLSPGRRQAIIWTNAGIIINWALKNKLRWNINRNLYFKIYIIFQNVVWKLRPFCLGLNVSTFWRVWEVTSQFVDFRYYNFLQQCFDLMSPWLLTLTSSSLKCIVFINSNSCVTRSSIQLQNSKSTSQYETNASVWNITLLPWKVQCSLMQPMSGFN